MEKSTGDSNMDRIIRKRAALHNLGCKVNSYETEAMRQMLEQAGYEIVPFDAAADLYVINTCSVTNIADKKSRQMIHRAKKKNPDAIVAAAGCYVQTSYEQAKKDASIDIIIGNNQKNELLRMIEDFEADREAQKIPDINAPGQPYEEMVVEHPAEHTRAFLKVQDGCNQFCSYCIIPYARGRVRSRRIGDVLDECGRLAANGYREIVLTGIHLSSYGIDCGSSLSELIARIHEVEGVERIRLGSLEPRIITEEFVQLIRSLPKVCPHFHLSLQSGSDSVLKRMNRHYTTAEYLEKCRLLRRYYEHPAITTDIIVGFPQETQEEFEETCAFVKEVSFYEIHVFKYSRRDGTAAARMPGQITEAEKSRRSHILSTLAQEGRDAFLQWYEGKQAEVLFEEKICENGEEYWVGFTPEYVKIRCKNDECLQNRILKVDFLPDLY